MKASEFILIVLARTLRFAAEKLKRNLNSHGIKANGRSVSPASESDVHLRHTTGTVSNCAWSKWSSWAICTY
jgi:hypothetical protein